VYLKNKQKKEKTKNKVTKPSGQGNARRKRKGDMIKTRPCVCTKLSEKGKEGNGVGPKHRASLGQNVEGKGGSCCPRQLKRLIWGRKGGGKGSPKSKYKRQKQKKIKIKIISRRGRKFYKRGS